jgi:hypothetical protein
MLPNLSPRTWVLVWLAVYVGVVWVYWPQPRRLDRPGPAAAARPADNAIVLDDAFFEAMRQAEEAGTLEQTIYLGVGLCWFTRGLIFALRHPVRALEAPVRALEAVGEFASQLASVVGDGCG